MPEFSYTAIDKNGTILKDKIQDKSRHSVVKKLKRNDLTPIEVTQSNFKWGRPREKKNIENNRDEMIKIASSVASEKEEDKNNTSVIEKIKRKLTTSTKITTRDIEIFTQNFLLLKRAGFNNIHALSTIIKSTENLDLRGILEDVLAGVEGGDYMYSTFEYYTDVFPYIYVNLIKVGELSDHLKNHYLKQCITWKQVQT